MSSVVWISLPVGIIYAVWSRLGIMLIAVVGAVRFRQPLDFSAVVGLRLILTRVVNVFSKMVAH